ncbi:MAG: RHS repeat domain-containing protein [Anaerolineae bacterium]
MTDAGRLSTVTDANGGTTSYFYDARSRVTRQNQPNGVYAVYGYDGRDRVTSIDYILPQPDVVIFGDLPVHLRLGWQQDNRL